MGKALTRALLSLAMLLACCACAFALDPSLDIRQYAHTSWRVRDGFPKGEIDSIAQTPDGYLWLGTEFGLYRFDGVRTIAWQPPSRQHVPRGWVRTLLVSRDGTLWIGAKGLASFKNGKVTEYPELANFYVFALLEDHEGTLWVGAGGTPVGKLCEIRGGSVHCYGDDGTFGRFVGSLLEDSAGNLWAGVRDGLWRWKPGPPTYYPLPGQPDGIRALDEDTNGALLVGWREGIYRFVNGKAEQYPLPGLSRHVQAERILHDRNGGLWIGIWNHGLLHVHQGRTDVFSGLDGLSGDYVKSLFEDREGNIWVSTVAGLDRFRNVAVTQLTVKQGLSKDLVGSVLADKDGSVWLATFGGLNRWDHGQITIPPTGSSIRDGKINGGYPNSLFQDDRKRIWAGTLRGLGYLENGQFSPIKGVPGGNFLSVAQDTAGNIWAINENAGLFRVSPTNDVLQIPWTVLGHKDHASVLSGDIRRGGLWIGFFLGGMSYFSEGHIQESYTATEGLGAGRASNFQYDDDGTLWVSTEGGLSRLKNNHVATLTSKNGLPCDTVHWSIEGDEHSMWLYTACGLLRIDRSELDAWAASADRRQDATLAIRVTVFDDSDGVESLANPGHYHPQVAKTSDGKIWFLPRDGVSVIDPHHLPFNKIPPPVHIEKVIADDKPYPVANGVQLPSGIRNLTIDYTALSLVVPEKVHFRYKLEGQDKDWREVVNDRHVEYTNLPPKHYKFRVLACNNSGVWNEEGAALDFVIPPAWYQTNWFRAACVLVFLGMIWGIHELRVRQLAHQFNMRLEERVGERTRIARDLHDTLLQSFQGLLLQFQAISYRLQPGEIKNALDAVTAEASQAITEGRDSIQGLRASTVEKDNLAETIRAIGEELASTAINQSPVAFEVMVEGRRRSKHPIVRDEVYRMAVEALRNAFRHAQATKIEVELLYGEKGFKVRIRDNGRGIDRNILSGDGRTGHFGLHGMRERAKLIGGELTIWSEADSGTEIELSISASRAYTRSARSSWFFRRFSQKDTDVKEKVES